MTPMAVLLPVRLPAPQLERAISSVRADIHASGKTHPVYVVVDGPGEVPRRDGTVVLRSPGHGLVDALNYGLEVAEADVVMRMDADDVWLPGRTAATEELVDTTPGVDLVAGSIVRVQGSKRRYEAAPPDRSSAHERMLHRGYGFAHPAVAVRKTRALAVGGYSSSCPGFEDLDLWLRMFSRGAGYAALSRPVLGYQVHGAQVSSGTRWTDVATRLAEEVGAERPCSTGCPGPVAHYVATRQAAWSDTCPRYDAFLPFAARKRSPLGSRDRSRLWMRKVGHEAASLARARVGRWR